MHNHNYFLFRRLAIRSILCAATAATLIPAGADVRLPKYFTSNMMVQRDQPVRVWGWAEKDEAVSVSFAEKSATTKADADGGWMVELPAVKSGQDLELTVKGKNSVTLKNIIIGDIWVCSGQSNMEMALGNCLGGAEDIKEASLPLIRRIKFKHEVAAKPAADAPAATEWQVCTPATAPQFTAVGFYFAREVSLKTGVPIGIVDSNWGGTAIEPWIALEGLQKVEALKAGLEARLAGKDTYCGMYNAMIAPIIKAPVKGALWYQGESNGGEGESYYHKMNALITGWRQQWGQGDFPFYFVQLASFQTPVDDPAGGNGWAALREAQLKTLALPKTGMAVITDTVPLAEGADIHPRNKYDVGTRLAQWALARDYGQAGVVASGPLFKSLKIVGDKAHLEFDYTGSGLMTGKKEGRAPATEDKTGKLKKFAIAGADMKWQWADAVIEGSAVVVSSAAVKEPVAVRYAFEMNPDGANLYNREGLPASPFRTDSGKIR